MKSFWLFLAGIAVLFAPIPLVAWAARGRWQDAWEAIKGYSKVMGLMLGAAAVLTAIMFIASATA
ncbi:hypothetical protein J2W30_003611 [Variovorax boronicumulans]|uniref:hypothetical protein n=1 Tax=Variovorax boronicumulans TaxID=436515 RepID=UPI00278039A2|nr:hypothetical protein [Variovorax boronicumulans]MDQ0035843.1 hypothetical protein [Variovorax boronicumulans]MDQ0068273.1 hypothetical protein [Variovorax boronicumulans]